MSRRSIVVALALGMALAHALQFRAAAEEAKKEGEVPARLTSEEAIQEALASRVTLDLQFTPLTDVRDFLKDLKDINIQLDTRALNDAGIPEDAPITLKVSDVTLRSALRLILRAQELTYVVKNEVLLITTADRASALQSLKSYDVRDLVASPDKAGDKLYEPESLINLIEAVIQPTTWDSVGGAGTIKQFDGTLVVSQQADAQEQIEELLAALRKVRASQDKQPGSEPAWADKLEAEVQAIEAALRKKVTLDFADTPLVDVAEFMHDAFKVPILIDTKALEDAGQAADTPISLHIKNITLASALRLLLERHDLTFRLREEVLIITTTEKAASELRTRVYPIRDLVKREARDVGSDLEEATARLVEVIITTVQPTTWSETGGPGSAVPLVQSGLLVISQTDAVFHEVDQLLALLRKSHGKRDKADAKAEPDRSQDKSQLRTKVYLLVAPADSTTSELAAQLVELAPELIAQESWQAKGALIRACGHSLVVRQTADVQKQVAKLLKDLGVDAQAGLGAPMP